ncbi:MAG TPA: NUDIX domain-containing protein [Bradyrhizobium sp.]
MSELAHQHDEARFADARRRVNHDPTGTAALRRRWRSAAEIRLRGPRAQLRIAVVDNDILGLGGEGMAQYQPALDRLRALQQWFERMALGTLGGPWPDQHVDAAWQSGHAAAARETGTAATFDRRDAEHLSHLAQIEFAGIAAALTQQVVRASVAAATKKMKPVRAYALMVRPFDKMAIHRLRANVNTVAVKAHNDAKLASYREAGVTRVGIVPESAKRKLTYKAIAAHDAFDPDEPRDPHGEWTSGGGSMGPETAKIAAHPGVVDITSERESIIAAFLTSEGRVLASAESESHPDLVRQAGTTMHKVLAEGTARFFAKGNEEGGVEMGVEIWQRPTEQQIKQIVAVAKNGNYDRFMIEGKEAVLGPDLTLLSPRLWNILEGRVTPLRIRRAIDKVFPLTADWNPDQPRIPGGAGGGEWTSGGGGGVETTLGHGYSHEAKLIGGVIHTSNVYDAVRAIYEKRAVQLTQPRQLSTLIEKLGEVAKRMIDLGGAAPDFNLCKVTVRGTNLFCADAKGIPRVKMPQLTDAKAFRHHLEKLGYTVTKETERPSNLRATQSELNAAKVAKMAQKIKGEDKQERIIVSREGYILDGHHRWGAQIALDAADNKFDAEMRIARVDLSITELLAEANKYTGGKGAKGFADWDPNQPREPAGSSEGGQFAGGVRTDYPMQSRTMIVPVQTSVAGPQQNIAVMVNPTFHEVEQLARETIGHVARLAFDKSNNVYAWEGYDLEHDRMVNALEKHIGQKILVNPRYEKVEREGDVPLYKLTTDPPSGIAALYFEHGKLVSSEHYAASGHDVATGHAHAQVMIERGQYNAKKAAAGAAAIKAGYLTVYHGTALEVADKIGSEGITVQKVRSMGDPNTDGLYEGSRGEDVFITPDKKGARGWAGIRAHGASSVVFEIHVPEAEWGSLRQEHDDGTVLARHRTIPPEWIKSYEVYGEDHSSAPPARVKLRDAATVVAWMVVSTPTATQDAGWWESEQRIQGGPGGGEWTSSGAGGSGGQATGNWPPPWHKAGGTAGKTWAAPKSAPPPGPLKISELTKVGQQMGSNAGGVYADASGKKFYVKQGKSADHVRNEMLAVKLYQLAGTPLLRYREVEGGKHIATEIEKLDKKNANALSSEERAEAAKDFAVHAWLANWDVVGLGGDNIGTAGGVPMPLDLGGALAYRAQGASKGKAFGDTAGEIDTLRDPSVNPDSAHMFGSMTPAQLLESAAFVTRISDNAIREAVKESGSSEALADRLIKRRYDIAQRAKTFGAEGDPTKPGSTVVFAAGDQLPMKALNGIKFKPWSLPEGTSWNDVDGQADLGEAELSEHQADHKQLASGLVIREPDGRVWLVRPKNAHGGYQHCVTLDSLILTKRGWLRYDEVHVGDETLGFDGGETRWTPVLEIVKFNDAEIVRYGGKQWSVTCTPNHRWVKEAPDGGWSMVEAKDGLPKGTVTTSKHKARRHSLLLAAPMTRDYVGNGIDAHDAAVISWLVTDGCVYRNNGSRFLAGKITQQKARGVAALDELLRLIPHTKKPRHQNGKIHFVYYLKSEYMRAMFERTKWHGTKVEIPLLVTNLSREATEAFFWAAWEAEGYTTTKRGSRVALFQKDGPVFEAMAIAAYKLGYLPLLSRQPNDMRRVSACSPRVKDRGVRCESAGRADVWCVRTALGTWTMRQGNSIVLTGNTFPKGRVESDLSLQANAIKEAWEEIGIKARITGLIGDREGDVTLTRYYLAERESGQPTPDGKESDGVVLAPPSRLGAFLNRKRDKDLAASIAGGMAHDTLTLDAFDPDEPRDEGGEWTSGSSGAVDKYGLDDDEQNTMWAWQSGAGYGPDSYDRLRRDSSFANTLRKFTVYKGTVYRGLDLSHKKLAELKVGSVYRMDKHSAASTSASTAENFSGAGGAGAWRNAVVLRIEQASGRRIPRIYNQLQEREIVLLKGSHYRITEVKDRVINGDKVHVVVMKEIRHTHDALSFQDTFDPELDGSTRDSDTLTTLFDRPMSKGPGSQTSREETPSPSTIYRIEKAQEALEEEVGEEVDVLTAGDELVCETCQDIADGGPYTLDEAEGLIPGAPERGARGIDHRFLWPDARDSACQI